jgi:hypothetical protein
VEQEVGGSSPPNCTSRCNDSVRLDGNSVRGEPGPSAATACLHRRARYRAVGAEHAAVALERLQPHPAAFAVVEELAGIGRHRLDRLMAAFRACELRLQVHDLSLTTLSVIGLVSNFAAAKPFAGLYVSLKFCAEHHRPGPDRSDFWGPAAPGTVREVGPRVARCAWGGGPGISCLSGSSNSLAHIMFCVRETATEQ